MQGSTPIAGCTLRRHLARIVWLALRYVRTSALYVMRLPCIAPKTAPMRSSVSRSRVASSKILFALRFWRPWLVGGNDQFNALIAHPVHPF